MKECFRGSWFLCGGVPGVIRGLGVIPLSFLFFVWCFGGDSRIRSDPYGFLVLVVVWGVIR